MNEYERKLLADCIEKLKGSDEVNIYIRKNGQDIYVEADWLEKALAHTAAQVAAARVNGASDYVAETYGKRCEVKDYDDFPELKDDPLANRCLTCEEWDRFDRWAAQLHKEQSDEG